MRRITSLPTLGTPGLQLGVEAITLMSDMNFQLRLSGQIDPEFLDIIPSQQTHLGDEGVRTIVQVLDSDGDPLRLIRDASNMKINLRKPSGATTTHTALFLTNGADGKIYFISTAAIPPFDETCTWWVQAVVTVGGNTQCTEWGQFKVGEKII